MLFIELGDDRAATVLGGAVSGGHLPVSYGIEADLIPTMLGRVQRHVGVGQFDVWFAEGAALDRVRAAAALVEQRRR